MEDKNLTELFSNFEPHLTSHQSFMTRLERNLDMIEQVKRQAHTEQRRNRVAVITAALAGFVFGVLSALCYPVLVSYVRSFTPTHPDADMIANLIALAVSCIVVVIMTCSVYDLALAVARSERKQ